MTKPNADRTKRLRHLPEALVWLAGLTYLGLLFDPYASEELVTCPVRLLSGHRCPGCGLGHSVGFLLRGEWRASVEAHPLGILAFLALSFRIVALLRKALD